MSVEKLQTNLSVAPYFDDYKTAYKKQYVRILFIPTRAVQTRELNQMQAMQQEQIARFGSHIFKEGAVVQGVGVKYIPQQAFVYVENNTTSNVRILTMDSTYLLTSNTGVRAVPRKIIPGFSTQYPKAQRIYLDYIRTGKDGANNDVKTFRSGETLTIYQNQSKTGTLLANNIVDSINVLTQNTLVTNAIGTCYAVSTTSGIIFQKGHFLRADPQFALVNELSTNVTNLSVGFTTVETIVNENGDATLNDNANGSTNLNAPGAHRLKLTPTLISVDKTTLAANSTFYPIVEFDGQKAVEDNTQNEIYSFIGDQLGKRTYEESGDYVVKPFSVESLNTTNNKTMYYAVSPGIGYVRGHRVELIGQKKVSVARATTVDFDNAQIASANYGSYVLVDEVIGMFSAETYDRINIYDTPQNSLTEVQGASAGISGSLIGTANIRAFVYESGTKGTSTCRYRLYLTNIKMNSGKSFAADAKAFAASGGDYGSCRADAVLTAGKAVVVDPRENRLYFPLGLGAVKRLTDPNGTNDSQFIHRDSSTATIQANGFVTFTTNSPYAGGAERLNNSVGGLSDSLESNYDIVITEDVYTTSFAGTVSASGTTVTGSGTALSTNFKAGEYIRIGGNVRRVVSVANATSMVVNASVTATANVYQKFWPNGHILDLSDGPQLEIVSNTQFTVETGMGSLANTVLARAVYPILRTSAVAAKKNVAKGRYVKINCSTGPGTSGIYNLGITDVNHIEAVYFGTTYSESNPDRKSWFTLDNGQTDGYYGHAQLLIKSAYKDKITSSTRLLVKLTRFTHSTTTGAGFFSVDSYPIVREGETANTTNIPIADVYSIGGNDFRDVIDFRAVRYSTANNTTDPDLATVNPAAANTSYITTTSGSLLIAPDTNFQCDVETYLPRRDLITMSKNGDIIIRKGTPGANPKLPLNEADTSVIASVFVPPFPSLTTREFESNKRTDLGTSFEIMTNRNWTMEDISGLHERISRLEYYATLSALEQSAKDMTVLDENGLDRFKNGIFADTFNSHKIGRKSYMEYKIAIDTDAGIARPRFNKHAIDFRFDSANSTSFKRTGNHLSLPYTSNVFINQPYASKFRNCTESVWEWTGRISLFPSYDANQDETKLPAINKTIDLTDAWEEFADSPFGTQYGDWRTTKVTSKVIDTDVDKDTTKSVKTTGTPDGGTKTTTTTNTKTSTSTTTKTTTTQAQDVTKLIVDSSKNKMNLGSYVTDVSMNPYIAPRVVAFMGFGFKPNTRLYAFFDGEPVSVHCAPGERSGLTLDEVGDGKENQVINRTAAYGKAITSNSRGSVYGLFKIPEGKFRTGDRIFMLTDVDNLVTGEDGSLTAGEARYTASSISISTQGISLTTIEPEISSTTTTKTKSNSKTTTSVEVVDTITSNTVVLPGEPEPPEEPRVPVRIRRSVEGSGRGSASDPLAQSFKVTLPESSRATGMIVDKIGVYFRSKDDELGITCAIMEMTAGVPDSGRIIAKKHLEPEDVKVSNNASLETIFDFESLAYLARDKFYAFYVQPDGDSPEYTLWCSEVGGTDVVTGRQIFSNPYVGVLFTSANKNTWTAIQTEDMKFKLYRVKFTTGSGNLRFTNEHDDYFTISDLNKKNGSVAVEVGDIIRQVSNGAILTSNTSPLGYVQKLDEANDSLVVDLSNGRFEPGMTIQIHREFDEDQTTLNANTRIASCTIQSIDNRKYSAFVPRFASVIPAHTSIAPYFKGTSTTYAVDTAYKAVTNETDNEWVDKLRMVASRSNERDEMASGKSAFYSLTIRTEDDYVSPIIDLRRKTGLFIENVINNDITDEHTIYGAATCKYVGPIVTLAEGQDAEDIDVYVTAYRPSGTNVYVYFKALNGADSDDFDTKVWTKMTMSEGAATYSSSSNVKDFREYKWRMPGSAPASNAPFKNTSTGVIEYTDTEGAKYIGYKSFALKIVCTSTDSARVPRLADVRALCLQV